MSERLSPIISPSPTPAELTAARRAAHSLAALDRARLLYMPGGDADAKCRRRNYVVLTKPNGLLIARPRRRYRDLEAGTTVNQQLHTWQHHHGSWQVR
ncbi:MAG TPA: hypothetical protein VI094_04715 [Propionibacteriaceae bacterium]